MTLDIRQKVFDRDGVPIEKKAMQFHAKLQPRKTRRDGKKHRNLKWN